MRNDRAIVGGERLDSGMTASEAIARAEIWWNRIGRHMIRSVGANDPTMAHLSGIIGGREWSFLSWREKVLVVRTWHHFKIRRPDVLDIAPDAPFKLGGEETVH